MLTYRLQIQALADELGGLTLEYPPTYFDPPLRPAYAALRAAPPAQKKAALITALEEHPRAAEIMLEIFQTTPGDPGLDFPHLAAIAADLAPITWLWDDWIPNGMFTLLGAVPEAGKSYIALDLARRIIHGAPLPDGSPNHTPGRNVVYVDAELAPQILSERATAWQLDTTKLYPLMPEDRDMIDLAQFKWQNRLIEICYSTNPALVIIDSLSTITAKGENSVEDVRELLGYLNCLASHRQCAVLLIHHLRKKSQHQIAMFDLVTPDDFRGSGHITAMARSIIGLSIVQTTAQRDPQAPRQVQVIKSNLCMHPEPLGVNLVPAQPYGVTIQYGAAPEPYREPGELERAQEWLLATLDTLGPLKPKEACNLAQQDAGISRATLGRARDALRTQIEDSHSPHDPANHWRLVGDTTPIAPEPTKEEQALVWLKELLQAGPMKPKEIIRLGTQAGFSRPLIYKAKKLLEEQGLLVTIGTNKSPKAQWTLATS